MSIMLVEKWIERVPLGLDNFLDGRLSLDLQRNKIMLPYPQPKRSMLLPEVVVHNFFRYDKLSRIIVTL
jgi:hypothetical protein